jgi:hypothetical protein
MQLANTATTTRRQTIMQSPIRALLYGIAIWLVWVSLVVFSAELLPTSIVGSPLFVSMQIIALATLVLSSTILYLRKVGEGSAGEGLLVGLAWAVVMVGLDFAHSVIMPEMVPDFGAYFAAVAPSYVIMPIITTLTMGYLERRSLETKS